MTITNKQWVLADQVVVSGSAFATNLIVARSIGMEHYGKFSAIVLYQLLVLGLLQAAFSGLMPVLLPRVEAGRHRSYTGGLFWLHQAIITLLFVLCVLLFRLASSWAGPAVWWAACASGVLYFMHDYLRKWLLGTQQVQRAVVMDIVANLPQLILLVAGWWLQWLSLPAAMWIVAATYVPAVLMGGWWMRPGKPQWKAMREAAALHGPEARWTLSSALLQWTAGNYFVLAAGWWLGASALGALRLAQYIFGLLNVVLQALEHYALPRAAQLHSYPAKLFSFLRQQLLHTAALLLPAVAFLVLGRSWIMQWTGGEAFTEYGYVFIGLALLYIIIIVGYAIRLALRVQLFNKQYFIGYVIATLFSLATAPLLVKGFGLKGILAGMILAQVLMLTYWGFILIRKNRLSWKSFTWYSAK